MKPYISACTRPGLFSLTLLSAALFSTTLLLPGNSQAITQANTPAITPATAKAATPVKTAITTVTTTAPANNTVKPATTAPAAITTTAAPAATAVTAAMTAAPPAALPTDAATVIPPTPALSSAEEHHQKELLANAQRVDQMNQELLKQNQLMQLEVDKLKTQVSVLAEDRQAEGMQYGALAVIVGFLLGWFFSGSRQKGGW